MVAAAMKFSMNRVSLAPTSRVGRERLGDRDIRGLGCGHSRRPSADGARALRHGGALAKMLLPFQLGVGGRFGEGSQWMSWIALSDLIAALAFLLRAEAVSGPVNLVAPNPVTNAEFARTLAYVLGRPAIVPVPRFALSLLFGEMGDQTVLASHAYVRGGCWRTGHDTFFFFFVPLPPRSASLRSAPSDSPSSQVTVTSP